MPKDEFDFGDPMEMTGVALLTDEDTSDAMCVCFIEEFMMMGCDQARILALFRHPHYTGMNRVIQNRGEQFVCDRIAEIFAQWGRPVAWPAPTVADAQPCAHDSAPQPAPEPTVLDPTGAPAPAYNL